MSSSASPKQHDEHHIREQFNKIIKGIYNQILSTGDICLEAGPFLGKDSLGMASLVKPTGKVHAFECLDENEKRLREHMETYSLHDLVNVHHLVLPPKSALRKLAELGNELFGDPVADESGHMVNFDIFIAEKKLQRLDFIKLSLGGAEFDALKSAYGSIRKHRPILLFNTPTEASGQLFNFDLSDVLTFIDKTDYVFFDLLGDKFSEKHWRTSLPWFYTIGIPKEKLSANKKMIYSIHEISNKKKDSAAKLFEHIGYITETSPIIKMIKKGEDNVTLYNKEDFNKFINFYYQPFLSFENDDVCQTILEQCNDVLKTEAVDEETLWQGLIDSQSLRDHQIVDATIRWIDDKAGYGLYTNVDISSEDYIGEFTGMISSRPIESANQCLYPSSHLDKHKDLNIDARDCGNELRFVKHSPEGNITPVDIFHDGILHVVFKAIKDIPAGSQLLNKTL